MKKKSLPAYFWLALAVMYGYTFIMMFLEMRTPGMTYFVKMGGAPASFFYNGFIGVVVLNIVISWFLFYMPEQDDKKAQSSEGGMKSGS